MGRAYLNCSLRDGFVLIALPPFLARTATMLCLACGAALLLLAFRLVDPRPDRTTRVNPDRQGPILGDFEEAYRPADQAAIGILALAALLAGCGAPSQERRPGPRALCARPARSAKDPGSSRPRPARSPAPATPRLGPRITFTSSCSPPTAS